MIDVVVDRLKDGKGPVNRGLSDETWTSRLTSCRSRLMWSFPQLLAVPHDSPAKSVSDLVALAKSKPGGLSFASQGTGSGGHLLGEMLKLRTGANMVHIPYRGAAPAATDLAAGRVDFFFVSYSSLLPFLQGGKVRAPLR